jgi:flagellar biosynthesis/type III secretory pathway M-ring protein FliF/YscJ
MSTGSAAGAAARPGAAATVSDNTPWVGPGLLGFLIVVVIGVATWFLGRSMVKQLRKLDTGQAEQQQSEPQEESAAAAVPTPHDAKLNGAH